MISQEFLTKIKQITSSDTSSDPEGWTLDNPLWGHCAVVSLLAQDYFGGTIFRGSLEGIDKYIYLRSHYWNSLPEGEIDFTAEQYPDLKFSDLLKGERSREQILSYPDTERRYMLLKKRFDDVLSK